MNIPNDVLFEIRLRCSFTDALSFELLSKRSGMINFWDLYFSQVSNEKIFENPGKLVIFLKNNKKYIDMLLNKINTDDYLILIYNSILYKNYDLFYKIVDRIDQEVVKGWQRKELLKEIYKISAKDAPFSILRILFDMLLDKRLCLVIIESIVIYNRENLLNILYDHIDIYDTEQIINHCISGFLQSRNVDIVKKIINLLDSPMDDLQNILIKLLNHNYITNDEYKSLLAF